MENEFKTVISILQKFADNVKEDFIQELKVARKAGKIDKTVQVNVKVINEEYVIEIKLEDYWKYIESGRKPGTFPNINALVRWIKAKKIIPRDRKKVKTDKQLAYLIGRSIKERGIKPLPILDKSINSNLDKLSKELEVGLGVDLEAVINNMYK